MKIALNKLFFAAFILSFMPTFVLQLVPGTGMFVPWAYIALFALYIFLFTFHREKLFSFIEKLLSIKFVKYYLYFQLFLIFTTFVHIVIGQYDFSVLYYYAMRFFNFYSTTILIFTLPVLGLFFNVKLDKIIKLFYLMIIVSVLIGLIQFVSHTFNIVFIDKILDFFSNARLGLYSYEKEGESLKDRVFGIFAEPGVYGQFLCLILPFVLKFKTNKYFIFILMFVLFTTVSPIFIIFGIIELFILFIINNKKHILKHFYKIMTVLILLFFILFSLFCLNKDKIMEAKIVKRITFTLTLLSDYGRFVTDERSLATRIYSLYHEIYVFKANPVIGAGLFNSAVYANNNLSPQNIPVLMSTENTVQYYIHPKLWTANPFIIFSLMAETGIIGTFLYLAFLFQMFSYSKKLEKLYTDTKKDFIIAQRQSMVVMFISSFYTTTIYTIFFWLMYGLILMLAYHNKFLKSDTR